MAIGENGDRFALLVIYGTEIPKESVILFDIKLNEDGKLKVSQKQVKRVIKEMTSGLIQEMHSRFI